MCDPVQNTNTHPWDTHTHTHKTTSPLETRGRGHIVAHCSLVWMPLSPMTRSALTRPINSPQWLSTHTGGDPLGQFAIEHLQNEWKVSVRKPLDREERDNYLLNITATDGTFAAKAVVEVKVLDANDNSPVCEKVKREGRPLKNAMLSACGGTRYAWQVSGRKEGGSEGGK